jgi:acylpyruvate hydrolase
VRLATVRVGDTTRAARVTDRSVELLSVPDVRVLLSIGPDWQQAVDDMVSETIDPAMVDYAPLVPTPSKIVCVGLNYRQHAAEMGADPPEYPTLFAKFAQSLIGAHDPLEIPYGSQSTDWEAELVIVAQGPTRHCPAAEVDTAIAGFTVGNDVSERAYQNRTSEWLQGKSWDRTTPVGPVMVTTDEVGVNPDLSVTCSLDGTLKQGSRTSDMIFSPPEVVAYLSSIMTLEPGDLIFLGTPSGVGNGRRPPEYLTAGMTMRTEIEHIGVLENHCVDATAPATASGADGSAPVFAANAGGFTHRG